MLLGVLIGTGVAALVVAFRAMGSGMWAGPAAAGSAVVSALPVLVALAVLAVVGVTAVTRWPDTGAGAARYLAVFALVTSALIPFLVLSGDVGGPSAGSTPATSPPGPLPTLAVVASVVAVGLSTALLWPHLVTIGPRAQRTIGRRMPRILTAASSTRMIARRRPLLPMVTAGFLAASCCLLVFTAGYRESLRQSGEDQAAFRVPLDVSVAASARIATPLEALDGNRLREVAPGTMVRPVVTSPVTTFGGTTAGARASAHRSRSGGADRDARVSRDDGRPGDRRYPRAAADCRPASGPIGSRSSLRGRSESPSGRRGSTPTSRWGCGSVPSMGGRSRCASRARVRS